MRLRTLLRFVSFAVVGALAPGIFAATAIPDRALLDRVNFAFSVTRTADLRGGAGDVGVQRFDFEAGGRTPLSGDAALTHGVGWTRTELDARGSNVLPDLLEARTLQLGWQQTLGPQWRGMVRAQPGFFGDGGGFDSDTFNVPLMALATYAKTRDLFWSFGLIVNRFGDHPVLPIAGFRWNFAPDWSFNAGLPRLGFEWRPGKTLTLTAGGTVQGSAYRLTRNPVAGVPGGARVAGAELDYRELRVGVGLNYKVTEWLTLSADAGVAVDQRFEFHERGLTYRGSDEFFGVIGVGGRF